jgi:hypothetical protein
MGMLIILGNAAAAQAGGSGAEWIQAAAAMATVFVALLALAASATTAVVIGQVKEIAEKLRGYDPSDFAKTLRADVKEHTATATDVLLDKLQTHPDSMETLRAQLRSLRSELSDPLEYIDRMKLIPPGGFPNPAISSAYGNWAGALRALCKTIDDLHFEMTYPLVNEPVVRQREEYLLKQYLVEQKVMLRHIDRIKAAATKLDTQAAKAIKKKPGAPRDDAEKGSDHG